MRGAFFAARATTSPTRCPRASDKRVDRRTSLASEPTPDEDLANAMTDAGEDSSGSTGETMEVPAVAEDAPLADLVDVDGSLGVRILERVI